MKDKLTIFRETEIHDKEELLICLRDLFVEYDRERNPKKLSPNPFARASQMHITYQQTQSSLASAERTHRMYHRRKENKTVFRAEKRAY